MKRTYSSTSFLQSLLLAHKRHWYKLVYQFYTYPDI